MPGVSPRKREMYVDNKAFLEALKLYRKDCRKAERAGKDKPQMPEFLGECAIKIANRIATKANFKGYTFKDDFISHALENFVQYVHNFDPEKGKNPFAYFSTMFHYAFMRWILRERKHTYIKYKLMEKAVIDGAQSYDPTDTSPQSDTTMLNFENVQEFITKFDQTAADRRNRRKQKEAA